MDEWLTVMQALENLCKVYGETGEDSVETRNALEDLVLAYRDWEEGQ